MKCRRRKLVTVAILSMALFFSCQKGLEEKTSGTGQAELHFQNMVGALPLTLNSAFTNTFGEEFSISKLKYYITNFEFLNKQANIKATVNESYFLVDEEDGSSKSFTLQVPVNKYNAISFLIGVDSLHNISGAQSGALDPSKSMFWTWNSGYIMAKLEGTSPVSSLQNNMIEYHIGGFKGVDNVVKRVTLDFPTELSLEKNGHMVIDVKADINAWFKSMHDLPISINSTCTSPGSLAKQYSENYSTMFGITSVVNQ